MVACLVANHRFLVSFPDQVTDMLPVELGEIAEMWARFEDYIKLEWPELAGIVMLNAEKELRREASGGLRHDKGSAYIGRGSQGRKTIYAGSLLAANQQPDRAIKLLSKAAGIIPWEDGDTEPDTQLSWLGEWEEPKSIFSRRSGVEHPPYVLARWSIHKTSSDFLMPGLTLMHPFVFPSFPRCSKQSYPRFSTGLA